MSEKADRNALAAELLEASATGFASAAATALGTQLGDAGSRLSAWKAHLRQRVLELAAAVRVDDASLFVRRVEWTRRAYQARGSDETELTTSVESLRDALARELPADLQPIVAPPVDQALESLARPLEPVPGMIEPGTPTGRLALEYLKLCLDGRTDAAIERVIESLGPDLTPASALLDVLIPAQRQTGQLWHSGDINVAEEHLVSETTRRLIGAIVREHAPAEEDGRVMLAASVAGNAHDIGLRIVSDLFRLAGWRCLFLGADVPPADIARAAADFDVDLVLLNATITTQLKQLGTTVDSIRQSAPKAKVLVGGLAFEGSPDLWKKVGADAFAADAQSALDAGAALLP